MEYWQKALYKSKAWAQVRALVIERDRNICQECGKLILKRADVHHVQHLTKHNHQDASIAINPDNLVTLHQECHNIIHERFGGKPSIVSDDLEIDYSKR